VNRVALFGLGFLIALGVATSAFAVAPHHAARNPVRFFFYSPTRTIECRFANGAVACVNFRHLTLVVLNEAGGAESVTIKPGFGTSNPACHRLPGDDAPCWFQEGGRGPTLRLGASAIDPDPRIYKCASLLAAIVCRSLTSGRGFRISDTQVTRLAAKRSARGDGHRLVVLGSPAGTPAVPLCYDTPRKCGWGTAAPPLIWEGGDASSEVAHRIRWTDWGRRVALGVGVAWTATPNGGMYPWPLPIRLRASNLGRCQRRGPLAYRRLQTRSPDRPGAPMPARWVEVHVHCALLGH
jgi:hypothetical protein